MHGSEAFGVFPLTGDVSIEMPETGSREGGRRGPPPSSLGSEKR